MKKLPLLLVLVISLLTFSSCGEIPNFPKSKPPIVSYPVEFLNCEYYGPFSSADKEEPHIFMSYRTTISSTYEIIKVRDINQSSYYYSQRVASHSGNKIINFDFVLPISDFISPKGIEVTIFIYDSHHLDNVYIYSIPLYERYTYTLNSKETKKYSFENTLFKFPYSKGTIDESFDFSNTLENFTNDDYYILPLEGINFIYDLPGADFTYKEAYLTCLDPHHYFDNCKIDGKIKIPLICRQNSKQNMIYFDYKETMYVEKSTFSMSLTSKPNFDKTRKFFLPKGKALDMDNTEFQIVILGAGKNEAQIIIPLTYYSGTNHFGYCNESDYCIRGEIIE